MTTPESRALADESYISLETFRKDGSGVKTPVWCAPFDGKIVVLTVGTSFKVKRIRNDPKVRLAPCDVRGRVRGAWVDGQCVVIEDHARAMQAHQAIRGKYGWVVKMTDLAARIAGRLERRAYLEITV
jgi:PPOX class probable F420-dependent enzyme